MTVRDGQYGVEVAHDIRIPTSTPQMTLSADVYRPVTSDPVPALVTVVPYRKDGWAGLNYQAPLHWFAEHGYGCLLVDMRGTGSSDGSLRPPFDSGEGDDAVAAIEWAARQPWCDGNVGMWGLSYAATAALRAASRRPPPLRAIVPVMGSIDPERDWVHPQGAHGGLASLGSWAAHNLKLQLLAPLSGHDSAEEQARWQRRLQDMEHVPPYIVDMFRHGPGDAAWRERVVDASAIVVPTLCIGGWRDVFCEPTIQAFQRVQAPKRMVVGPWTHTLPHRSATEPVDFYSLAKRWFDRWLSGIENGVDGEPGIVIYVQGHQPGWRVIESWPTPADELLLSAGNGGGLEPAKAEYQPDPTTGVLSGLWFAGVAGLGEPLDQHDDDSRAACFTSDPLREDVTIVGRPVVTANVTPDGAGAGDTAPRVVVRLAHVDEHGRSTFITGGLAVADDPGDERRVILAPTAYRVPGGNRLRVVISDADFPRLWPLADARVLHITGVLLRLPVPEPATTQHGDTVPETFGIDRVQNPPAASGWAQPRWTITRDVVSDGIEVVVGRDAVTRTPDNAHLLESHQEGRARVQRDAPELTEFCATDMVKVRTQSGSRVEVAVTARLTHTGLHARGEVTVGDTLVFSRTWES